MQVINLQRAHIHANVQVFHCGRFGKPTIAMESRWLLIQQSVNLR